MNWQGLTTMPSPPRPVSSSHHRAPFASLSGSARSTILKGVVQQAGRIVAADGGQRLHVPEVILVGVDLSFGCQQVERGELEVVERLAPASSIADRR